MYGLVNKGVKDLVLSLAGEDAWNRVRTTAGIEDDHFETMMTYPDDVTYKLVSAVALELKLEPADVLVTFGKYWIKYTAQVGYGDLMNMFGGDLLTCLNNLNSMHARMGTMMPQLVPPRFKVVQGHDKGTFLVRYESKRPGLAPMVKGLLEGLAEKFGETVIVTQNTPKPGAAENETEFTVQKIA